MKKTLEEQSKFFRSLGYNTQEVGRLLQQDGYSLEEVRRELNDPTIQPPKLMPDKGEQK